MNIIKAELKHISKNINKQTKAIKFLLFKRQVGQSLPFPSKALNVSSAGVVVVEEQLI